MPRVSRTPSSADALHVSEILCLDRRGLVAAWIALHGAAPPRSISQPLLRRILALDLQLRAAGGWPHGLEARFAKAAAQGVRARTPEPVAGGRLLREWNGITHVVEISRDGYRWNGQHWRSLSVIAREITGAHWSGPRFFGLTAEKKARRKQTREIPVRGGSGAGASAKSTPAALPTATPRDQVSP